MKSGKFVKINDSEKDTLEEQVRYFANLGLSWQELIEKFFPDLYGRGADRTLRSSEMQHLRKEARTTILGILGLSSSEEYTRTRPASFWQMKLDAFSKAKNWWDQEKADLIIHLFNEEKRMEEIRQIVFPEWFDERPRYELRPFKFLADAIVLKALECKGDNFDEKWVDYDRKKRNLKSRRRYREKKEQGEVVDKKAIQAALKRDGYRCVVTGSSDNLQVHHINGDKSDNELNNLVTLARIVHDAIHSGAHAYTEKDMKYWDKLKPKYTKKLRTTIEYLQMYTEHLHKMGYTHACMESILGAILLGTENPCGKLHIRSRGKRLNGWYWVVFLKPTGYNSEPEGYRPVWDIDEIDFDDDY